MTLRTLFFGGSLISLALQAGFTPTAASKSRPVLVGGAVPFAQVAEEDRQAAVWLNVSTDGRGVSDVQVIDGPSDLIPAVVANIRTWRFLEHNPATFPVTFTYRTLPSRPCERDGNTSVKLAVPWNVDVETKFYHFCEARPLRVLGQPITVSTLGGIVRCANCDTPTLVAGAALRLRRTGETATIEVRTDSAGRFQFRRLAPGEYRLEVIGDEASHLVEYQGVLATIRVEANGASTTAFEIERVADPRLPPLAEVTAAAVPTYPEAARSAAIEGTVVLRLSLRADSLVDAKILAGNSILAQSAIDNVRTWKFRNAVDLFDVTFRFWLQSSSCKTPRNPYAMMQFPQMVEVTDRPEAHCGR